MPRSSRRQVHSLAGFRAVPDLRLFAASRTQGPSDVRTPYRAALAAVRGGPHGKVEKMRRHQRVTASGVRRPQSERLRRRQRWYFALMGVCLLLILLAWNLVRVWSTTAAVAMSVVAAVLPPIAVVIANWGEDR